MMPRPAAFLSSRAGHRPPRHGAFAEQETNVTVVNGVATLTGTVDTWADRSWAAENAREGGASKVRNQIAVRDAQQGAFWMPFF